MEAAARPAALADALRPRLAALTVLLRRESARGLTATQTSVLRALRDGRPMRMTDLADREGVSLPTMSVVVRRLEDQGWVCRTPGSEDRRVVHVAITAAGGAVLDAVAAERRLALRRRLARLDTDDRLALAAALPALDRLIAADHPAADHRAAGHRAAGHRAADHPTT